jgi:putative hemolysin
LEDTEIGSGLNELFLLAGAFFQPVDLPVIIAFIIMLLLLIGSALISGSEIAFFSLNATNLKQLQSDKSPVSQLIINLLERPKRLLATILIANNFVNISIVVLSTFIVSNLFNLTLFPLLSFLIQVVLVTSLLLIFGEITPKIYASYNPMRFASVMAGTLKNLIYVFYPFSSLLVKSSNFIDKALQKRSSQLSMSELSEAIELTSDEETPEDERQILQGIVKFGDMLATEIMKPRIDVTAVDVSTSYDELLKLILNSGYSRIPAYTDSFDKIAGILYIKDLLPHLDKPADFKWPGLLRPAFFVPENKKINDLLQEFQEKKIHMAIVVDEYGGTSGIVTMEDIIEEIVGEISDEFDTEEDELAYTKLDDKNYLFEGKTLLNDFCKILKMDDRVFDNVKGDSETLAGLILEIEGKIPMVNASTKFQDFEFKIKKVSNRRIEEVLVKILK